VDADTLCLKPFEFDEPYVFASQGIHGPRYVNVAAIKAPPRSAAMQFAWETCERIDTRELRWGQSGPELITRAVEQCSLERYVQPPEVFCPIDFPDWHKLLEPADGLSFDGRTYAVHLWNEMWRRAGTDKDQPWDAECLYEQWKRRYLG
jgi:Alpha 1,4-glycosyltransferase conserved region